MKHSHLLYIGLAFTLCTASCRKYVEITQEGQRVLELTQDYDGLLNNTNVMLSTYSYLTYSSDDGGMDDANWQNNLVAGTPNANAYTWGEKIITDGTNAEDNDWLAMYRAVYYSNQVITNVMNSKGGTDADKLRIRASALVHRAFYYHTLVNIYASQYDSATAATAPGLPLRLDDLIDGDLTRVSVQTVYNQILADLNAAVNTAELPDVARYTYQASKASAYAMLARTYLNMRNFTAAREAAAKALQLQGTLLNLNNYTSVLTGYPQRHADPEVILLKTASTAYAYPLSNSLKQVFADSATDLRYIVLTRPSTFVNSWANYYTRVFFKTSIANNGYMSGPTVPEMMLIQAECEARAGNTSAAVTVLNNLRKQRYTTAGYTDVTAGNGSEALQLVLRERRKELMNTGIRWFDQRRLQKDGFISTVTRTFKGATYTLAPGSNRYTFPIADKYIYLNPEIQQNPR
ncbi:hypothetical protein HNQ91_002197 [Filimonas zeae]|uniref:RagB/SusD family nutrient uptake outer membrane protein n=1 Tax=Filimonas zeae TaxID=1737353 RepID=A0A917IUK2_9BACT|nr:RagB/SusD family nutrient uptake outer membrane protein [Filimonas zeae]MDR6339146.1 hypothetical protein [Filimonas zeae]GGH64903.1 hypothetical protein GCM10011379_17460 [Filimonas zeae]